MCPHCIFNFILGFILAFFSPIFSQFYQIAQMRFKAIYKRFKQSYPF